MKTSIQILPGIKAIGMIDCRRLPKHVALTAICGGAVAIFTDLENVEFFDDPKCECKTTKENGGYKDTVSLKFLSRQQLPHHIPMAIVVTDVNNNSWLIGSKEVPVAVNTSTRQCGAPGGDSAGISYEISHVAIKSMVPCIL